MCTIAMPVSILSPADYDMLNAKSCPVCNELLTEPFRTNCGHCVCSRCRLSLLSNDKAYCPVCHKTDVLRNARFDRRFQLEVNSLRVRCQHHDKGCKWVGEVRDLQDHLDSEKMSCPNAAKMVEHTQQTTREYNTCIINSWFTYTVLVVCNTHVVFNVYQDTCMLSGHGPLN